MKNDVIKKALKFLVMLKNGKQITTRTQLEELKRTMEQLNSMMYE